MSKIVDLKNTLVNDYLRQKDQAIQQIYTLQKENALSANDAATAVDAIKAQSEVDVLDLTKTFYQQMFGMSQQDEVRTANQQTQARDAVTNYLAALGQTPVQINQLVNEYVQKGYTAEDAMRQLSDDIRNGTNPVLNNLTKNNAEAAKAAQAKFETDMAMKLEPIKLQGEIDLALLTQKQEFEKAQKALDRKLSAANAKYTTNKDKVASEGSRLRASASIVDSGGTPIT